MVYGLAGSVSKPQNAAYSEKEQFKRGTYGSVRSRQAFMPSMTPRAGQAAEKVERLFEAVDCRKCLDNRLRRPRIAAVKPHADGNRHVLPDRLSVKTGCPCNGPDSIPGQPTTKKFLIIHDSNLPVWHTSLLENRMPYLIVESQRVGESS